MVPLDAGGFVVELLAALFAGGFWVFSVVEEFGVVLVALGLLVFELTIVKFPVLKVVLPIETL